MSHPQYPSPHGWPQQPTGAMPGRPTAPAKRPWTVLAAVIMAYLGSAVMVLGGSMLAIGARDGEFLGKPTDDVQVAGTTIPIEQASIVGTGLTSIALVVLALAVFTQRGSNRARIALTVIGMGFAGVLAYSALTGEPLSPVIPLVWIALAVVLLWAGGNAWFQRPRS